LLARVILLVVQEPRHDSGPYRRRRPRVLGIFVLTAVAGSFASFFISGDQT
jgi:hypothetical protein